MRSWSALLLAASALATPLHARETLQRWTADDQHLLLKIAIPELPRSSSGVDAETRHMLHFNYDLDLKALLEESSAGRQPLHLRKINCQATRKALSENDESLDVPLQEMPHLRPADIVAEMGILVDDLPDVRVVSVSTRLLRVDGSRTSSEVHAEQFTLRQEKKGCMKQIMNILKAVQHGLSVALVVDKEPSMLESSVEREDAHDDNFFRPTTIDCQLLLLYFAFYFVFASLIVQTLLLVRDTGRWLRQQRRPSLCEKVKVMDTIEELDEEALYEKPHTPFRV
ncbi:hypothetical protein BCR37DRAFT_126064 [Protomyces lactucae-debilis]|uniref:Protein BIG1 n=1 Tax=Protomyces lactucae-debilis TaxID=2754530 RepID=A0A1Y2FTC2_PROLT|nr:uncharacterized protein BCR37DRAFT_126064 [Protomyces lactucae-debilis]ORY86837.1 hypothetical protein BCR37DRAFT_126064 [Protomyces lactucae-debilis]